MTKSNENPAQSKRDWNSFVYEHSSHQTTILAGLQSLRENELLYDITLVVSGKRFKAHKVVLASCSDYFRVMFTKPMLESRQNQITLNGLTDTGFKIVLEYIYTARLGLDQENVQDVLSAATHIQLQSVVYACSSFLQNELDIENCVDIANIAENYDLAHLKNMVYMFMSGHFVEFSSNSSEFSRLSPQQLKTLLACDYPVNCSEVDILKCVCNWFLHSDKFERQQRFKHISSILSKIHFTEITPNYLKNLTDKVYRDSDEIYLYRTILPKCRRSINLRKLDFCSNKNLLNSRGMELAVLKIGGFDKSGMTNVITYRLANGSTKWRNLTSVPHVEQCNFGTVVFLNELYVVGGCFNQTLQETIHPFGFKYNPWFNKWSTIAPMNTERCRFSLNVVGSYLYAIGGSTEMENHEDGTSSCERYDPASDTWENIAPLLEHRTQHAGAAYESDSTTKWLFISGGLDKDTVIPTFCCYDTVLDRWRQCQPMLTPRADHVMIPIANKIYVCGGWTENSETGIRTLVNTIDVYDVVGNVWNVVTRVPTPRNHPGIVFINGKIYFIGGFHKNTVFHRHTSAIECYDIAQKTWTTEEKYPQVVWEHSCVTLYVPKCRDDMEVLDL